ncbi:hypothetical protein TNCV_4069071, partial [Trichonephila clavipes]
MKSSLSAIEYTLKEERLVHVKFAIAESPLIGMVW